MRTIKSIPALYALIFVFGSAQAPFRIPVKKGETPPKPGVVRTPETESEKEPPETDPSALPGVPPRTPQGPGPAIRTTGLPLDPKLALTPTERLAAIYQVAGLPEPFREAEVLLLPGVALEIAEAGIFLGPPKPFEGTLTFSKEGLPTKKVPLQAHWGWRTLDIPQEYEGGTLQLSTSTEAILYRHLPADTFVFGADRRTLVTRFISARDSRRRVPIRRSGVREDLLPKNPADLASNPETAHAWTTFLQSLR